MSPRKHSQLKPTLGPVQLMFYGIGVIVGAGVYSVIGAASAIAQDALWLGSATTRRRFGAVMRNG